MTVHPIPPFYNEHSTILILGSFPSVRSRETGFFYGHPQNRFWKVLSMIFEADCPETIPEKKAFLDEHRIALWDVIGACDITGSSDASIRNAVPNDLTPILKAADIHRIFVNGRTAQKMYMKYTLPSVGIPCICLPSTSPANAAWTLPKLAEAWGADIFPQIQTDPHAGH